jgi:hypothetical protein
MTLNRLTIRHGARGDGLMMMIIMRVSCRPFGRLRTLAQNNISTTAAARRGLSASDAEQEADVC